MEGEAPRRENNIWIPTVKMGNLLLKIHKAIKNLPFKNHVSGEISQKSMCDEKNKTNP